MDSITLIITGLSGVVIGTGFGMYVAAILSERRIASTSAEAWRSAERFYKTAYTLTPKG